MTLIQPFDVNRKRLARIVVAQQARKVLEAQYQNAVRREIDNLYTAILNVLEAREAVRYARVGVAGLGRGVEGGRAALPEREPAPPNWTLP